MAGTVKDFIETCMSSYTEDGRQEWLITHPGQAILTVVSNESLSADTFRAEKVS